MVWFQIFQDGPEFEARTHRKTFVPPNLSPKDLYNAIPQHLFERSALKSSFYIAVHVFFTAILHVSAKRIPVTLDQLPVTCNHPRITQNLVQPIIWVFFWGWQGMFFAGIWCLGQSQTFVPRLFLTQDIRTWGSLRVPFSHKSDADLFPRLDMMLFLRGVGSMPYSDCRSIHSFWLHTTHGEQPIGHIM